ncbi:uncharacterized protein LOC117102838 [Anneissia japonica]|uniref:uncharacterized protein LOC117102838 n=1 Tax=Anneissia japonica TaxID=1529436 RepID=UPI0014257650|nr:uncharacterized protein LOC117102838 [Anneissia japonica]
MGIQKIIREFMEKRSSNKGTKNDRPYCPWWRRFPSFRKFFMRKRKNKVSPVGDHTSSIRDIGKSTSENMTQSRVSGKGIRNKGLFRSKSESSVNSHRVKVTPPNTSHDSGIADMRSEKDTIQRLQSSRKSIAWSVSFHGEEPEGSRNKNSAVDDNENTGKDTLTDLKVLWNLVNADSSILSDDEWTSFQNDAIDDIDTNENDQNSVLLRNLNTLQCYNDEMVYMLQRANETWSKICRGPFPHLKNHTKEEVVNMMSRGCIDNSSKLITKLDNAMKDVYDVMNGIDDHLGQQIDFKNRIRHDRDLKEKRPGRINLARSYLKPNGFPTCNFRECLDMVVEDIADDTIDKND